MMNLLIIHSHNANRGDEAAVKAMVDELLNTYPDANIVISNNGFTPYPCMPNNVKQINRFPKLQSKIAQLEFFIVLLSKGKISFTKDAKAFLKNLRDADLVIHAPGGPSIGDTYLKAEGLYLLRLDFIRRLGIPYMFYAPSMGPFNNQKRNNLRKKIIGGAKRVILRDPISIEYVKGLLPGVNVEQALDSALQHDIDLEKNEVKFNEYPELRRFLTMHKRCIGITITDLKWHPIHKSEPIVDEISTVFNCFIDDKIREGYGIVFIPQLYGNLNDTQIMNNYMRESGTFMVDAFSDEREAYFQQYIISKLYAVVGMRYHSNIFSAKMGTPFVSISYEQKMKGFMQSIQLLDYCIDLKDFNLEILNQKFRLLEKNHDQYAGILRNMHDNMKYRSYTSTQAVIDIIEEGNSRDK